MREKHQTQISSRSLWDAVRALLGHDYDQYWIVLVFAVQAGALSLAIPLAVQTFVNTVSFVGTLQPIIYLSLMLLGVLTFSVVLQLLQLNTVEKLEQRLFGINFVKFASLLPSKETPDRETQSRRAMHFWDLLSLTKSMKSIFIEALAICLQMLSGLILIAFYHPWLLMFGVLLFISIYILIYFTRSKSISLRYALSLASHDLADFSQEQSLVEIFSKESLDDKVGAYLECRQQYFKSVMKQNVGLMLIYILGSSILLGLGGVLVVKEQLALGQLVASEIVVSALLYNIWKFGLKIESIDSFFVAAYKFSKQINASGDAS